MLPPRITDDNEIILHDGSLIRVYGIDQRIKSVGYTPSPLAEAAQELLEACEAAITATGGSSYWNGETEKFLKLCEAAVAKVRGIEAVTTN